MIIVAMVHRSTKLYLSKKELHMKIILKVILYLIASPVIIIGFLFNFLKAMFENGMIFYNIFAGWIEEE